MPSTGGVFVQTVISSFLDCSISAIIFSLLPSPYPAAVSIKFTP